MKFSRVMLEKLNKQEAELEKLIEEKQIELIHHPERREKITFAIPKGPDAYTIFYLYREETPMSVFREVVLLNFFLHYPYPNPPKERLLKCVELLRMLPAWLANNYLYSYHHQAAQIYPSGKKSDNHFLQALQYGTVDKHTINQIIDNKQSQLMALLKILSYTLFDRDRENSDNLYTWSREQYEVVETALEKAISLYGTHTEYPNEVRAYFYFCQSLYYNQTKRYTLAQKAMQTVEALIPVTGEDEIENYLLTSLNDSLNDMDYKTLLSIESFMASPQEEDLEEDREEEETEEEYTFDKLYEKAEQGNPDAQACVAYSYEQGIGVTPHLRIALEWWKLAAKQGNPEALERLEATN